MTRVAHATTAENTANAVHGAVWESQRTSSSPNVAGPTSSPTTIGRWTGGSEAAGPILSAVARRRSGLQRELLERVAALGHVAAASRERPRDLAHEIGRAHV